MKQKIRRKNLEQKVQAKKEKKIKLKVERERSSLLLEGSESTKQKLWKKGFPKDPKPS